MQNEMESELQQHLLDKPTVQRFFRNFVFCSLAALTLYNMVNAAREIARLGDVTKMYGFNPGRVLL